MGTDKLLAMDIRVPVAVGSHFTVMRYSARDWILRDSRVTERARWGSAKEIAEDICHALAFDCLPAPSDSTRF